MQRVRGTIAALQETPLNPIATCLAWIVAVVPLGLTVRNLLRARKSRTWPTVEARIAEARVVMGGKGSRARIRYRYATADGSHESERVVVGGQWGVSGDGPERLVRRFPEGSTAAVAVDPRNPRYSVLVPGVSGHQVLSACFVAVGSAMLWVPLLLMSLASAPTPVPPDKSDDVGAWQGSTMSLVIAQDGSVRYKRDDRGGSRSLQGPLKGFHGDDFDVAIGPMTTTFVVSRRPYRDGERWKMVVDEVELLKSPGEAAGATPP